MTHDTHSKLYTELEGLLDRERRALIDGDLSEIAPLIEEKEHLLESIAHLDGAERESLVGLQNKAMRNQALLDNALQGIRNVAARFSTLRRIRKSLETYDEKGRKASLTVLPESKVEKRA